MHPAALRTLAVLALLAASACRRSDSATTAAPPSPGPDLPAATADAPARWSPEEIFRRAFWRQPAAADRIVHAEREEDVLLTAVTNSGSRDVQTWRWALAVHPGPELLAALRNPETFGLVPAASPRPWTATPAWFPAAATADMEVLQAHGGHFTVLYRAADNLLYATDAGGGFAPPAK